MRAALWWTGFTLTGLWMQALVPGVDFLAPGLVVAMQENRTRHLLWLAPLWVLVQEGLGGLAFGYAPLWYAALALAYVLGRWFFDPRNFFFVCLLGAGLGGLHVALTLVLASLQDLSVLRERLLWEGFIQAAVFPAEWLFLTCLYPEGLRDEYPA